MSRSELVRLSGVSKQQLSRLENGQIRLRLDHLKPFAQHLGYSPEQILLWGRLPAVSMPNEAGAARRKDGSRPEALHVSGGTVSELEGRDPDSTKSERWAFPASFVREQLHSSVTQLRLVAVTGDSMAPTLVSGDRVVVDIEHREPTPDGLYVIQDPLGGLVVKRLQLLRSSRPKRIRIISDNPIHAAEDVPVSDVSVFGKVVCTLRCT